MPHSPPYTLEPTCSVYDLGHVGAVTFFADKPSALHRSYEVQDHEQQYVHGCTVGQLGTVCIHMDPMHWIVLQHKSKLEHALVIKRDAI